MYLLKFSSYILYYIYLAQTAIVSITNKIKQKLVIMR